MKFSSMALLLAGTLAACSKDVASPSYLTNGNAALPTVARAAAVVPPGCLPYRSTGYMMFVGGAWSGSLYSMMGDEVLVSVPGPLGGGDLTERAIDRIIKGRPYRGEEVVQFNYADGVLYGEDSFTGQPSVIEGHWNYHAAGKFTGGTERYAGATGTFESQGPFLMYPALDDPNGGVALLTTIGHICLK